MSTLGSGSSAASSPAPSNSSASFPQTLALGHDRLIPVSSFAEAATFIAPFERDFQSPTCPNFMAEGFMEALQRLQREFKLMFVACGVCGSPVCRPCYEYERKDGNQSCQQCKTRYKRHKGSSPIHREEVDDRDVDDVSDFNYPSGGQDQKQKIAKRMLSWHMSYAVGEGRMLGRGSLIVGRSLAITFR